MPSGIFVKLAAVKRCGDFAGIANQMRRAVEALDALTEITGDAD
jgi:hypothetical protein